ncbi:hypothetical protein [Desulfospira joergensenii]|uniref:hypothetical protein n=1 Tax=Desulfospira joergensenii TaxID=53329 RepID=UPI0003B400DB|nr:hypothetical protein [Desulfospira joergensenii]
MKSYTIIILSLILGVCFIGISSAEEATDYRVVTDIVYELANSGNVAQIGDFTVSEIRSVWQNRGEKDAQGQPVLIQVSRSYIRQGKPASVFLIKKDESGFWTADRIVVYSGKGLKDAIQALPLSKRKELLGTSD